VALALERHALGLTWVVEEPLTRTSHALLADGRVWLVDPVDEAEAVEQALALGTPAGVIQLLDRHNRDCATLAARLGVPHHTVPDALPGTPFEVLPTVRLPRWREASLWWGRERALVVAEALGTNAVFTAGTGPVGVHPMLRLLPPTSLRRYRPEHLLMGHGPAVHGAAASAAVDRALGGSRKRVPSLLVAQARRAVSGAFRG
jgi:hypothetical protein